MKQKMQTLVFAQKEKSIKEADVPVRFVKDFQSANKDVKDVNWTVTEDSIYFTATFFNSDGDRQATRFSNKGTEKRYYVDPIYYPHAIVDTVVNQFPKHKITEHPRPEGQNDLPGTHRPNERIPLLAQRDRSKDPLVRNQLQNDRSGGRILSKHTTQHHGIPQRMPFFFAPVAYKRQERTKAMHPTSADSWKVLGEEGFSVLLFAVDKLISLYGSHHINVSTYKPSNPLTLELLNNISTKRNKRNYERRCIGVDTQLHQAKK